VGVVRRDPMAMLPFCGYNMADYFHHWLEMGKRIKNQPKIFRVNWFRKDANGKFLWPGYGENIRVLKWILERVRETGKAVESPIGYLPSADALDVHGLRVSPEAVKEAISFDKAGWIKGADNVDESFKQFGNRLPTELADELRGMRKRLS